MGATRGNLRARPKILKKISEHQINQSKRKFSQKKVCVVPQMCTRAKNSYEGYPTEFAGSTQNPRKYRNIKSTNKNENFPKKSMFSTSNVYRSHKFVWGLSDGICPGSLKNVLQTLT
jgi:hypothetical protein